MNEQGKREMPTVFPQYMAEHARLEAEYNQIPNWREIKKWRNIRQREKLNKAYIKKMQEWGLA